LFEWFELDADGQSTLELRDEVRRLARVERAARYKQYVRRVDVAVFGIHRRTLYNRQQVALHALAARVGAVVRVALLADLVDLVDEDDAVLLDGVDREARDGVVVDVGVALEELARGGDRHLLLPRARTGAFYVADEPFYQLADSLGF
jgi:hypothetical protein